MPFQEMKIKGAWIHTPIRHGDERGHFEEQFKISQIESELGRTFRVKQVNQSVSHKGVIRGIHYTDGPEGQAKYVSCPKGAIWDVVVDLRKGSPTFGEWDAVEISAENGVSVFIAEGLGHSFLSLAEESVATYLCSAEHNSGNDKGFHPLSPRLGIKFDTISSEHNIGGYIVSFRDSNLPLFKD